MENMALKTPSKTETKIEPLVLVDDRKKSQSPETVSEASEEEDVEEYRKRFVGEVDLPESEWLFHLSRACLACDSASRHTGACYSSAPQPKSRS